MASNAAKGQRAKLKTRDWFVKQGFAVALLERIMWIPRGNARPLPIKKDQLGADLLAVNDYRALFVQVKAFGTDDRRNALTVKAALAEFAKHPCPPGCEQVVVVWQRGARLPRLVYARKIASTIGGVIVDGQRDEGLCQHGEAETGRDSPTGRARGAQKRRRASVDQC